MAKRSNIKKLVGLGVKLRSRLEKVSMSQLDLANATGLSRQTVSRAIRNDEASSETLRRINQVLDLTAPTAVDSHRRPNDGGQSEGGAIRSRFPHAWVTASDLVQWSDRRDAQEELPRVVRRLILLTADGVHHLSFRSGEGVQLSGWDGVVTASKGNAFVPEGDSVWELGTSANPAAKAQADYEKRSREAGENCAKTTFVIVTSRRWPTKDAWLEAHRRQKLWKDLRVIDADDLEAWLETAPSVHLWLSGRIGAFPDGAQDLASWWDAWTHATRPPIGAAFLLAGRDDAAKAIQDWRSSPVHPIGIRSESRQESVAVAAAALQALPPGDAEDTINRAVVVEDTAAWRRLVAAKTPLILIPIFDAGDLVASAVRGGHGVLVPLGEGDVEIGGIVSIPPINRAGGTKALVKSGETDENRARELAGVARRSMLALRRRLAVATSLQKPEWARPAVARTLLPALFAGSWNETVPGDREILARLGMSTYENLKESLNAWTHFADPPLRRRESVWYLVSREDAWDLLGQYVKREDLARFENVAIDVLGVADPRFDLPNEQRWMSEVYGKRAVHSGLLRRGIAGILGMLGAKNESGAQTAGSQSDRDRDSVHFSASRVVGEVLKKANSDWRLWASLSDVLGDLAEAAPDAFLSALETGLRDATAPISELFSDKSDALFGSSPHTGLLWALERLSWSPDYLGRVVDVLADLSRQDPGGRLANRPSATLHAIFRPWFPQTAASLDKRFRVLDSLASRNADLAWDILISTLPEFHSIGMHSAHPQWREWANDRSPNVKRSEYGLAITGAVDRLIRLAQGDRKRWSALIDALPNLGTQEHEAILRTIEAMPTTDLKSSDRLAIWTAVRKLVATHRGASDLAWAMTEAQVTRIDALRERFVPEDIVERFRWLFGWHADLPDAKTARHHDYAAYEQELRTARRDAVRAVNDQGGVNRILELSAASEQPQWVGEAFAEAHLCLEMEDQLFSENLDATEAHRDVFARGYAFARSRENGHEWTIEKVRRLAQSLTPRQKAALLSTISPEKSTWEFVASLGDETDREYWSTVAYLAKDEDLEFALRKLLQWGRIGRAVDFMGMYSRRVHVDPELMMDGLERLLRGEAQPNELSGNMGYHLGEMLDALAREPNIDHDRIARIEWGLLPVLDNHTRKPKTLHRALADQPALFVELISLVFRGEGDPKKPDSEITEEDRHRASRAFALLRSWRDVPGLHDDNTVDRDSLFTWIRAAREGLSEARRLVIGDQQIGQMLSGSPPSGDGTWPCEQVRAVIEEVHSQHLETGISIGVYNSRGVTSRGMYDGGFQERALAERYDGLASAVADTAPRTAGMLRGIAANYRYDARQEDQQAALEQDLDG
jgi:transcriptional regulator with XRE-family HTH domain